MADTHLNRIKQAVSGTPGTGTITLGAAATGFKALGASQNAQTFSCLFLDGAAWEIATGCTYTHSGTSLTRGAREDSSTGAAISLTSAATVSVILPASRGVAWDNVVDNFGAEVRSALLSGVETTITDSAIVNGDSVLTAFRKLIARFVAYSGIARSWTAAQRGSITTLTDGATVTPDFALNNFYTLTLGGNRTLANPTNLVAGQSGSIFIVQDATGSRLISSWGSNWDFAGGTLPTLSTAANAVDRLDYLVRTTGSIHANLVKDVK